LSFIICFDLFFMRLSQSHYLGHRFGRLIRLDFNNFFYLFSIRLPRSHDYDRGFDRLTQVKKNYYFLIYLFYNFIFQYLIDLELGFIILFFLLFIKLSRFYYPSHGFGELTRVASCFFKFFLISSFNIWIVYPESWVNSSFLVIF